MILGIPWRRVFHTLPARLRTAAVIRVRETRQTMVVLAAPTPSTEYVRIALLVNGLAMLSWAPRVMEGRGVIRWAEGPRAVEKKTPFDLMIWRICGIWVACVGATPGLCVGLAALGNITLGSFLLIALLIDTRSFSRAWLLILPAIMVGIVEFYPARLRFPAFRS